MQRQTLGWMLGLAGMLLTACDPGDPAPRHADENQSHTDAHTQDVAAPAVDPDVAKQQTLSHRLTALDFFSERMWPGHDGEAGLNWLRTSAAGSGLELTRIMPEVVIKRDGVAVRPVTLQAEGAWADVVGWLESIEASPRRLVLRDVQLQTLRSRVVADLKLAVLIDRPTGLDELAKLDVADLRGEELDRAIQLIETELRGKSQTLTELGADASWSRPIADLTALMPASARPVNLGLGRYGNDGRRASEFTGSFTLVVPDAGLVPTFVRDLQKREGFAAAGLQSLRDAGADWQRATVTFTFDGGVSMSVPASPGLAGVEAGNSDRP